MKKLAAVLAVLVAAIAMADGNVPQNGSTPVAISSNQAATTCVVSSVASGSQATATVPAVAGQFFYVSFIEIQYGAIAAPAATLLSTTSTNLPGALSWSVAFPAAVGNFDNALTFTVPIKSSVVGTATVITGNAGVTSISENIKVCGFYAL
jgi:hypothetical protein